MPLRIDLRLPRLFPLLPHIPQCNASTPEPSTPAQSPAKEHSHHPKRLYSSLSLIRFLLPLVQVIQSAVKTRVIPALLDLLVVVQPLNPNLAVPAIGAIGALARSSRIQETLPGNKHVEARWCEALDHVSKNVTEPELGHTTVLMLHSLATSLGGVKTIGRAKGLRLLYTCATQCGETTMLQACKVYEALTDRLHILGGEPESQAHEELNGLPLLLQA